MAKFSDKYFTIITVVAVFVVLLRNNQVAEGQRQHFYARRGKDLRQLAHIDFEIMVKLKSLKEIWEAGELQTSHSLLTSAAETYLENFSYDSSNTSADRVDSMRADHVEEILRNPLAMLKVIHRLGYFLRSLNSLPVLDVISDLPLLTALRTEFEDNDFPLRHDLADAANAILKIQFMYNLKAADLSQGLVYGMTSTTKLHPYQCYYIGRMAKSLKKYTLALEWFVEAKRLAMIEGKAVDIPAINAELVEMIKYHDKFMWKLQFKDPYFFVKPLKSLDSTDQQIVPTVRDLQQLKFAGKGRNCSFWEMNVWSLCSGENLNTPEASSHLFCWNEFKVHKIFSIGPLRMEFLSRNPDVLQIHNAFSNAEITEISAASADPGLSSNMEYRIEKKVEAITGLQIAGQSASDSIEFVGHLPGGNVETHVDVDSQGDNSDSRGDRIATAMIYLNDVNKGGYTVFPTSFAAAIPSKGSVVFWFNTFSDGSPDYSTTHEECPAVWGEKLVAYKRMRFYDQFKVRKCLLQPKERFAVLLNGEALPVPRIFAHKTIGQEEFDYPAPISIAAEAAVYNKLDNHIRKYAQSPSANLEAFLQLDLEIYQNIKRLLGPAIPENGNGKANLLILRYLQDFNETAYTSILSKTKGTDAEAVKKLSGNPSAVYRAFWRFEYYIKEILRIPPEDFAMLREIRNYIGKVYNGSDGPLERDLEDTMTGLLNLQFVHNLKSQDIARGIVARVNTGIILSAKQCIGIGNHAISKDYYYQALNWMETAVAKITSENDTTVSLTEAEIHLETAKKVHDRFLPKSAATDPAFYTSPVSGLINFTHVKTRKDALYNAYKGRNESQFTDLNLAGLCQGKLHQTIQEQSKLFCWYEHQVHAYFRVGPLQVELLSMHPKPEVVMYHNVSSQRLLAFLRNDTGWSYTTCASTDSGETDSKACLLASTLVYKNHSADALNMLKLASRITGLDAMRRGILVHASGPGGHNGAHTDSGGGSEERHGEEDENKGMATVMFYVTEPEMGGMTAFAQAGIQVPAKVGSVLYWLNTLSSGALDTMSYHAGCPVIFGQKRIATVLVSYVGQSHLKCSTDPMRRLEVFVNGESKYGYG